MRETAAQDCQDRSISLREPVSDEIYTEQGTEFLHYLLFPD